MCGLVAIVTKQNNGLTKSQVDAFNNLLYIDSLRGMDSTGTFLVENNGDMAWNKEASPSPVFVHREEHRKMLSDAFARGRALVGHNRAATRGVVNDENAHPFTVDNRITLVHNGTLWGDHKKLANVEVDSHAIAHVIHECGDDVEAAMKQIHGAYALIWHDHTKQTLNFLRNDQRPLHWVETNSCYLWASEANMLDWILSRYPDLKPTGEGVQLLDAGTLVTFDFKNRSWSVDNKEIDIKPVYNQVTTASYTSTGIGYSGNRNPYSSAYWGQDEDDVQTLHQFGGRPACDITHPVPQTSSNVTRIKQSYPKADTTVKLLPQTVRGQQPRILAEEQRIARDAKMDMSVHAFSTSSVGSKDKEWISGVCLDYVTVAKDSASSGFFLYARCGQDHNYLVRVHIEPDVDETVLLDLTINNHEALFQTSGRSWRCYHNASDGLGFASITASRWRAYPKNYEYINMTPDEIAESIGDK